MPRGIDQRRSEQLEQQRQSRYTENRKRDCGAGTGPDHERHLIGRRRKAPLVRPHGSRRDGGKSAHQTAPVASAAIKPVIGLSASNHLFEGQRLPLRRFPLAGRARLPR
jgi:hypothetical protein